MSSIIKDMIHVCLNLSCKHSLANWIFHVSTRGPLSMSPKVFWGLITYLSFSFSLFLLYWFRVFPQYFPFGVSDSFNQRLRVPEGTMGVLKLALFQISGNQCNVSVHNLLVTVTVIIMVYCTCTMGTQMNISFIQSVCYCLLYSKMIHESMNSVRKIH